MDSNSRDESPKRRREEALARRLAEALDREAPGGPDDCPDAELIAAYREQALGPEEAAGCEMHFATCSRCRKVLAVLAASDDTPLAEKEVARLGELVAAARAPRVATMESAKPARPQSFDWRMRWLAPALGMAAVLAVWFAMRPPWRTMNQGSTETLVAQATKNEPLPAVAPPPAEQISGEAPGKRSEATSVPTQDGLKNETIGRAKSDQPAPAASAMNKLDDRSAADELASSAKLRETAPENEVKEQAGVRGGFAGSPPPAPAPMVAPPPKQLAQAQRSVAGEAVPTAREVPPAPSQSVATAEAVPVGGTAGGSGNLAGNKQAAAGKTGATNQPSNSRDFQALSGFYAVRENAVQIKTPSGKAVWRVGKSGVIERSTNAGGAWTLQASPSPEEWLAGAAVSETVCWIAGRNGAIARTTDGERWEKIAPPPMSADASGKFPDWMDINATGAEAATLTASDQRRYATQDGGKTWRVQ